MGASVNASGGGATGGRRRGSRPRYQPMAEINVTPFVDVMLVLLIIFMVAAPLLTVGVPIELPKTKAKQVDGQNEPLAITVNQQGQIFLQETKVELDEIVPKLVAITKAGFDEQIFLRGDQDTAYGTVSKVMGTISAAGFRRITLVTDIEGN